MALSDHAKKSNIIYLVSVGGTKLCKALLLKRIEVLRPSEINHDDWSMDKFLDINRNEIHPKLNHTSKNIVFPSDKSQSNLEKWDICAFCCVLMEACQLGSLLRMSINQLKKIRNKFFHWGHSPIDDDKYDHNITKLDDIFKKFLDELNDDELRSRINNMFSKVVAGKIDVEDLSRILDAINNTASDEIIENVQHDHEDTRNIVNNQHIETRDLMKKETKGLNEKFDTIIKLLEQSAKTNDEVPDAVGVEIGVKNCRNAETEYEFTKMMVQCFNEEIEQIPDLSNLPNEKRHKLREVIHKICKSCKDKGYIIQNARDKCILLEVQCTSMLALMRLYRDYLDGSLDACFHELQAAVQNIDSFKDVCLEIVMYEDDFLRTLFMIESQNILPTNKESTKAEENVKKENSDNDAPNVAQLENGKSNKILLQVKPETHFEPRELKRIIATETKDIAQCYGLSFHTRIFHGNVEVDNQETLKTTTDFSEGQPNLPANENVWKDIERMNEELRDKIVKHCERTEGPEVIMLIGKSGAGKSAVINTIHKGITGENYQISKQAAGHVPSVTLELKRFDNCGVKLESITDDDRRQKFKRVNGKLPRILDFVGLGDENTAALAEILELQIGGYIPPKTMIEALEKKQKEYGIGSLKRLFNTSNPKMVVTKVVFVQSCMDEIPKKLIECLNQVLKITDPQTLTRKYTPEVFLLVTKYDLVRDPREPQLRLETATREDDDGISLEEFEGVEKAIAPLFNIVGALKKNCIRWASITDRVESNSPYFAYIALKFLERMVEPGAGGNGDGKAEPVVGIWQYHDLEFFRLLNILRQERQFNISPAIVLVVILLSVVLGLFYELLTTGL